MRQHNAFSLAACRTPKEGEIVCIYFASVYCASTSIMPEAKATQIRLIVLRGLGEIGCR